MPKRIAIHYSRDVVGMLAETPADPRAIRVGGSAGRYVRGGI